MIPKSLELLEAEFWNIEIGQFVRSSPTVVLSEKGEWLRGRSILIDVQAEQFWGLFWTFPLTDFYVSRPTSHIANQDVRS